MAKPISQSAFGRMVGVSHTAVQKAVASGRISQACVIKTRAGRTQISDIQRALDEWNITAANPITGKFVPADDDIRLPPQGKSKGLSLGEVRIKTETYKAKLAELDYKERSGELVKSAAVTKVAFEVARETREAIRNVPNRIGANLASLTDPLEVEKALTAELNQCLEDLAETIQKMDFKK